MSFKIDILQYKILFFIIAFIGFQQFPVIKIGGSLKIYEVAAILLMLVLIINQLQYKPILKTAMIIPFLLFVVSPILSTAFAYIFLSYPNSFFLYYPGTQGSFKFNYYVFPLLQILYSLFNFTVINAIYTDKHLLPNLDKLLKFFVIVGSIISVYSLISFFTVDIITLLPSFIQNKSIYQFRTTGISKEPSGYVFYQGWITLFTFAIRNQFKKSMWIFLFILNLTSLLLTISTSLVILIAIIIFSIFVLKTATRYKFYTLILLSLLVTMVVSLIHYFNFQEIAYSLFVDKLNDFFSASNTTMGSGNFRSYTTRIGYNMFLDYPLLGVGLGNSMYYMHEYDAMMNIVVYGEKLHPGSFPQNLYTHILSEQGIFGGLLIGSFVFYVTYNLFINRNKYKYSYVFFIGGLFNIAILFVEGLLYLLYLWIFLALALKYFDSQEKEELSKIYND